MTSFILRDEEIKIKEFKDKIMKICK